MDAAVIHTNEELLAAREELYRLGDADPDEALRLVKGLTGTAEYRAAVENLQAGVLIDVGARARRRDAVEEGVQLLRLLTEAHPDVVTYQYNLGNGLLALAEFEGVVGQAGIAPRVMRQEARKLLGSARPSDPDVLVTQALTNLGNSLSRSHRWSEAHDAWVAALERDPKNGMAAGSLAQLLLSRARGRTDDAARLRAVAFRYAKIARENVERVMKFGGPAAVEAFARLPDGDPAPVLRTARLTGYLRFIARHHLALVPTIEGLDPGLRRWDSAQIRSLSEPIAAGSGPPPLLAMYNTIKAGYLAARRLAYQALETKERQTGTYADTLDYSVYGTDVAFLLLAQRAAVDVLDQIAVALNHYLGVGIGVRQVGFRKLWREDRKPTWRPVLEEEVGRGNVALLALGEMAEDLSDGFLRPKLEARNASTHRFTVLHDEAIGHVRTCEAIEHVSYDEFARQTIGTLQAVRAAILYFVEVVALREHRGHGSGKTALPMSAPAHHVMRGQR